MLNRSDMINILCWGYVATSKSNKNIYINLHHIVKLEWYSSARIPSGMEHEENEESEEEGSDYEESVDESEEEGDDAEAKEENRESLESQIAQYEVTIKKAFKAKKMADEANALNELGRKDYHTTAPFYTILQEISDNTIGYEKKVCKTNDKI